MVFQTLNQHGNNCTLRFKNKNILHVIRIDFSSQQYPYIISPDMDMLSFNKKEKLCHIQIMKYFQKLQNHATELPDLKRRNHTTWSQTPFFVFCCPAPFGRLHQLLVEFVNFTIFSIYIRYFQNSPLIADNKYLKLNIVQKLKRILH